MTFDGTDQNAKLCEEYFDGAFTKVQQLWQIEIRTNINFRINLRDESGSPLVLTDLDIIYDTLPEFHLGAFGAIT
ncbi:hypothetical protein Glove_130g191 [Diversispora epigaea]|uniref:Uncharacterized protein n=1 Tax=Diversispora epigaea TaxID=1348612 RepID=A0A397IY90_9GLOM|nr:hypothetical protein Glove_130g191 [Diversispora epigaea]